MDLGHLWTVVRRWWWLPVVSTVVAATGGVVISKMTPPTYQTSLRLLVHQGRGPGTLDDFQASQKWAETYGLLLQSPPLLQETVQTFHLALTPASLRRKFTAQVIQNTPILEITVADTNPYRAATIADGLARVLIAHVGKLQTLPAGAPSTVTLIGPAAVPTAPVQPNLQRNLVPAVIVGLLVGLGLALLIDPLDDRVRDPREIQELCGVAPLAVLGVVRAKGARILVGSIVPGGPQFTSALHLLRAHLAAATMTGPLAVCISSAAPREGTSTVAANLAILEAKAGKRVVLVDANLRHPHLHLFFGVPNAHGLSNLLAQPGTSVQPRLQHGPLNIKILPAGSFPLQDDAPTVQVLPAAWVPFTAAELLGSPRMVDLVALLRNHADVIIIDSPPLFPAPAAGGSQRELHPDTLLLQRAVDGTLLVMDVRRTGMKALGVAVAAVQRASGTMLGVVLNKSAARTESSGRGGLGTRQEHARSEGRGEDGIIQPQVVRSTTGRLAP